MDNERESEIEIEMQQVDSMFCNSVTHYSLKGHKCVLIAMHNNFGSSPYEMNFYNKMSPEFIMEQHNVFPFSNRAARILACSKFAHRNT